MISMLIKSLGDKRVTIQPSTITESLVSENKEIRESGQEQLADLMQVLVSKYKTTIFPMISESIASISNASKDEMEALMKNDVIVHKVYMNPDVSAAVSQFTELSKAPAIIKNKVTIGTIKLDSTSPIMKITTDRMTTAHKEHVTFIINGLISGDINLIDVISGSLGDDSFSHLIASLNTMIMTEAPDGSMGTMNDFRESLQTLKHHVNFYAKKSLARIRKAVSQNDVIFENKEEYISVYAAVIDSYYDKGGVVEGIYGLKINANKNIDLSTLLEHQTKFIDIYKTDYSKSLVVKKSLIKGIYVKVYRMHFYKIVQSLDISNHVMTGIESKINSKSDMELSDIKTTVTDIVADFLYPETGIRRFVDAMEYYKKEMSMEEAAGLAALDMVIDYVTSHVHVI